MWGHLGGCWLKYITAFRVKNKVIFTTAVRLFIASVHNKKAHQMVGGAKRDTIQRYSTTWVPPELHFFEVMEQISNLNKASKIPLSEAVAI